MHTSRAALSLTVALLLTGCGSGTAAGPGGDALVGAADPSACSPGRSPGGAQTAHVDYVPFLRHGGLQYVRSGPPTTAVPAEQVGAKRGEVTCTLSEQSYDAGRVPRDGDAGLLPVGTAVHELAGATPTLRLLAQEQDGWQVYDVDDDPSARSGADLLDLRSVVRVSLVESQRGEDVVRSTSDPASVARIVAAVADADLVLASAQQQRIRGPQWFVRFELAAGPPVQRAWYPQGRLLFPRIVSPDALHEALLG